MKNCYEEFVDAINKYDTFTILMHNNPDGDSIASMFVMQRILEKMNKKVDLAIHNYIPENYKFWFDKHVGKISIPSHKNECLIIVDTPNEAKTYKNYKDLGEYIIVIDHHKNSTKFGDLNIMKVTTCTGIIIYELMKYMNVAIDKSIAEWLFISLCWDTDGFKNSYATSYVYEVASELISIGAVPQRVFRYLFEYKKRTEIKVQRFLFNSMVEKKNLSYIKINERHLNIVDNNDIYNFINYVKLLDNVELFIMFIDRGTYIEIKMNNNQEAYVYLKNKYTRLYNIPIVKSFDDDVDEMLDELEHVLHG